MRFALCRFVLAACCVGALPLAAASAASRLAVAMDLDGGLLQLLDPAGGGSLLQPFTAGFTGGVRVAVGDIDGDGRAEIIAGSGPGMPATVRLLDEAGRSVRPDIQPFGQGFSGGVYVAAGDINGDGRADVLVGAGGGGGGAVRIFDGHTGAALRSFTAFADAQSGVRVAAGDVDGDGEDDIIVGPGAGGGPHVKVFDGQSGGLLREFDAFAPGFTGGVFVASGDLDGDGFADIVVGSGAAPAAAIGGGPHVKVFSGADQALLADFRAYDPAFTGGVRVATADVDGDGLSDILGVPGEGGDPMLSAWLAPDASPSDDLAVLTPSHRGGLHVAAEVFLRTIHRDGFEPAAELLVQLPR